MIASPLARPLARPIARPLGLSGDNDPDALAFFARAGVTNPIARSRSNRWYRGLKALGKFGNYKEGWDTRAGHNAGTGSVVYGHRNVGNLSLVNGPTWGANGIVYNGTNQYSISDFDLGTYWPGFTLLACFNSPSDTQAFSMYFGQEGNSAGLGTGMVRRNSSNLSLQVNLNGSDGSDDLIVTQVFGSSELVSYNVTASTVRLSTQGGSQSKSRTTFIPPGNADRLGFGAREKLGTPNLFAKLTGTFGALFDGLSDADVTAIRDLYKSTIGEGLGL